MPTFETHTDTSLHYQSGFANDFATEALPGALPHRPQLAAARGLTASTPSRLSGTAFTAPRAHNRRSWLYRIRPAAVHMPFTRSADALRAKLVANFAEVPPTPPNQLALGPAADARRADRFHRRLGDDGRQRRGRIDDGLRDPPVRGEPLDDRTASSTTPTANC